MEVQNEALVNITWNGQNGDLADPVSYDATDAEIRHMAFEAIRTGSVQGIAPDARVDLGDFVVDRFPATAEVPYNRLFVRPKTPFGQSSESGTPIDFSIFAKVELRAGTILAAVPHPDPAVDKLLVLTVDLDEPTGARTIVAGIAKNYACEDLLGQKIVVVANLKPRDLRGVESKGMLLAAGGKLVTVDAPPGSIIG